MALLSCGPVGPGDKAGSANKTLLMRTCRADGLLLKPGYPATPLDRVLSLRAESGALGTHGAVEVGKWTAHKGEVNVAYTTVAAATIASDPSAAPAASTIAAVATAAATLSPDGGGTLHATLIGIDLPEAIHVSASDLGYDPAEVSKLLVWDARDGPTGAKVVEEIQLNANGKADFHLVSLIDYLCKVDFFLTSRCLCTRYSSIYNETM